jgi:hypothetical protein
VSAPTIGDLIVISVAGVYLLVLAGYLAFVRRRDARRADHAAKPGAFRDYR